jgi:hypothetical protein
VAGKNIMEIERKPAIACLAQVRKGVRETDRHPLVLPSLGKKIYGAKVTRIDF